MQFNVIPPGLRALGMSRMTLNYISKVFISLTRIIQRALNISCRDYQKNAYEINLTA